MDKIIVGFSKPSKNIKFPIVSWLIRLIQNTPYSHVYVRWYSDSIDRDIVYQASGTMVNFMGMDAFRDHAQPIHEFELECTEDTLIKTKQFAIDRAGYPYGVKQIIGILVVKIARLLGKKIKNPFADGNKTYVCSELIGEILKEKFNLSVEDLDTVDPKEIFCMISNLENVKKLL